MRVIGITGGVGSGKSRVLSYLESKYHAVICQADHVAWKLQEPGEQCYQEIVSFFGTSVLCPDGSIDRSALGSIVFSDADKMQRLNQIMHPAVKSYILEWISQEEEKGTAYFIIEAALLLEERYQLICHEIWYIYCDETLRRIRLKESRGYTDEKISAMMAAQLPEQTFRENCQVVIDNSGDFEHTCVQVERAIKN